jgi:hypothetical protein
MLYIQRILVTVAEHVNLANFNLGLNILLSEIQLLRTSLYLNEEGKGYTILETVFSNSILIDQIIQKISKTHLYFSGTDFKKIDKLFVENKINELLDEYDKVPRIAQTTSHLESYMWWYLSAVIVFMLVLIVLVIKKAM